MSASISNNTLASASVPILRFARPTRCLSKLLHFYQTALGLAVIASFDNHRGFDGRILALPSNNPGTPAPWHLEFTLQHDHAEHESVRAPTQDNLLVLYLGDKNEVEAKKARMEEHGYHTVNSVNPYWDDYGVTF
ncbi:prolyl endopeptidase, partial [Lobosporangium transversale]